MLRHHTVEMERSSSSFTVRERKTNLIACLPQCGEQLPSEVPLAEHPAYFSWYAYQHAWQTTRKVVMHAQRLLCILSQEDVTLIGLCIDQPSSRRSLESGRSRHCTTLGCQGFFTRVQAHARMRIAADKEEDAVGDAKTFSLRLSWPRGAVSHIGSESEFTGLGLGAT